MHGKELQSLFSFHFVVFVAANFRKLRNAVFSLLPFSIAKLWHHKCKFFLRFAVRIPGTWSMHVENLKTERNENGSEIKVKEDDHKQSSVLFQMFHLHLVEHWRQWKMVLELKPKNKTKTNRLSYFKETPWKADVRNSAFGQSSMFFNIHILYCPNLLFSWISLLKPWGTVRWSKIIAFAHCVRAYVTQSLIIQHFFLDFH